MTEANHFSTRRLVLLCYGYDLCLMCVTYHNRWNWRGLLPLSDRTRILGHESNLEVRHAFNNRFPDIHCALKLLMYDTPKCTLQTLQCVLHKLFVLSAGYFEICIVKRATFLFTSSKAFFESVASFEGRGRGDKSQFMSSLFCKKQLKLM